MDPDFERFSTVTGLVQVPVARDRKAFEALSLPDDAEPLLLREGLEPLPQSKRGACRAEEAAERAR